MSEQERQEFEAWYWRFIDEHGGRPTPFQAWQARAALAQQAAREPLTAGQARRICAVGPVYAPNGKVERSPSAYRIELQEARLYGIREAERAHGIQEEGA